MTGRCRCALILGLVVSFAPSPTEAKVGDRAWAQCVWQQAPASADTWLTMQTPAWPSPFKGANVLLGHKLIALCDNTAIDPLKPNRMPNWKAAASALRRSKPKTSFIAAARPVTCVALCETRIDDGGKPVPFRYEITKT